jgi:hypothetical protein
MGSSFRGSFEPLLPDLILKKRFNFASYIGSDPLFPPPSDHTLVDLSVNWSHDGELLIARVRLFAMLGAPLYYVIVGKRFA